MLYYNAVFFFCKSALNKTLASICNSCFCQLQAINMSMDIYSPVKHFVCLELHKLTRTWVKVNFSEWVKRVPLVKISPPVVAPANEFNNSERSEVDRVVLCASGRGWAAALSCSSIRFCSRILFLER